jgi:hypothetical protein
LKDYTAVIYRGLISGYTAIQAVFVAEEIPDTPRLALDIVADLFFWLKHRPGYTAMRDGSILNS